MDSTRPVGAKKAATASGFDRWMAQAGRCALLTAEEELELGRQVQEGSKEARNKLVVANVRRVYKLAWFYAKDQRVPLPDLLQEGMFGLIRAAERYDPEKGFRFGTYATWCIRRAIVKGKYEQFSLIHEPEHMRAKRARIHDSATRLAEEYGREPTDSEIARNAGLRLTTVQIGRVHRYDLASLDATVGPVIGQFVTTLGELLKDEDSIEADRLYDRGELSDIIVELLNALPARERAVLVARHGLNGMEPATLMEIGDKMGLSRERIRQLEFRAMAMLRNAAGEVLAAFRHGAY